MLCFERFIFDITTKYWFFVYVDLTKLAQQFGSIYEDVETNEIKKPGIDISVHRIWIYGYIIVIHFYLS